MWTFLKNESKWSRKEKKADSWIKTCRPKFSDRQLCYFLSSTFTLFFPSDRSLWLKKPSNKVLDRPFRCKWPLGLRTKIYVWHNTMVYLTFLLITLNYKVQWHFPTSGTTFQVHLNVPTSARTFLLQRNFPTSEETF